MIKLARRSQASAEASRHAPSLMIKLAIMQGRLSPPEDNRIQCFPRNSWHDEFPKAVEAGIPAIEWIDDTYGADVNPLRTPEGIEELHKLMKQHGVTIPSVCADSYMEQPLIRCTADEHEERLEFLGFLILQAHSLGANHLGIPLLDNSALKTREEIMSIAASLNTLVPLLRKLGMEIHLETSLSPEEFPILLNELPDPYFKVTYDTGNSASLGYDPHKEFVAYGNRVGSVHIKDRKRGGGTVPLGTGDTVFGAVKEELQKIGFDGLYTLQAARGETGSETETIKGYSKWITRTLN